MALSKRDLELIARINRDNAGYWLENSINWMKDGFPEFAECCFSDALRCEEQARQAEAELAQKV
jgi:hypothetical protein